MVTNRKEYTRRRLATYGNTVPKIERGICRVCNQPRGDFHNDQACADRWIKELDAQAKEGRNP